MRKQAAALLVVALLVLVVAVLVLRRALAEQGVLAELLQARGRVQRQRETERAPWEGAAVSDRFRLGDAVRTGPSSTARVVLRSGGGLELRPETVVRFSPTRPGVRAPVLRLERGEVELQSPTELRVDTSAGTLRASSGSRVVLRASETGAVDVEVTVGRAVVERFGAVDLSLRHGEHVALSSHLADAGVQDAAEASASPRAAGPDASAGEVDARASDASEEASTAQDASGTWSGGAAGAEDAGAGDPDPSGTTAEGPSRYLSAEPGEVSLSAGDTASLHADYEPVRVRLAVASRCNGPGTLALAGRGVAARQTVSDAVTLVLPRGSYRYRVQCGAAGESVTGSLRVDGASAGGALPSRPPSFDLAMDGHRYSVQYQNLPPAFAVSWPSAPASPSGYVLHVRDSRGQDRTERLREARVRLPSGRLREGTYAVWMAASNGAARSPETAVVVQFDNDAPVLQLREPRPGQALGATIRVEGTALVGSTVTVGDTALQLDRHQRFAAEVPRPEGRAFVLRIAQPTHGTNYYLRRLGAANP